MRAWERGEELGGPCGHQHGNGERLESEGLLEPVVEAARASGADSLMIFGLNGPEAPSWQPAGLVIRGVGRQGWGESAELEN